MGPPAFERTGSSEVERMLRSAKGAKEAQVTMLDDTAVATIISMGPECE